MKKEEIKEEFKKKLNETIDSEKEIQDSEDSKTAEEIIRGSQEVFIRGYDWLIFNWPDVERTLEGDDIFAKFKTKHLRNNDLMTTSQLKAVYNNPITIKVDGKDVVVGSGEWTEKDERRLEEIPKEIDEKTEAFNAYRVEIQELKEQIKKRKNKQTEEKLNKYMENAFECYSNITKLNLEHIELQTKRINLFSTSLEERAQFEKVKYYAPYCIMSKNGDGTLNPLWKDETEMLKADQTAVRILSLFGLFLRGVDVSFFGDLLGGQTQS